MKLNPEMLNVEVFETITNKMAADRACEILQQFEKHPRFYEGHYIERMKGFVILYIKVPGGFHYVSYDQKEQFSFRKYVSDAAIQTMSILMEGAE